MTLLTKSVIRTQHKLPLHEHYFPGGKFVYKYFFLVHGYYSNDLKVMKWHFSVMTTIKLQGE